MTTPQLSYPGVYVQEIPSGSRSISGVATAVTAFLGRAVRGPVDEPVPISSFGDFERVFGGLWRVSGLGYAVRDYFLNGGGNALVVRLAGGATTATTPAVTAGVAFVAAEAGSWAEGLTVRLTQSAEAESARRALGEARADHDRATTALADALDAARDAAEVAERAAADASTKRKRDDAATALRRATEARAAVETANADTEATATALQSATAATAQADLTEEFATQQGVEPSQLWRIEVLDGDRMLESFSNVTFVDGPRRADLVLQASRFVRLTTPAASTPTGPTQPATTQPATTQPATTQPATTQPPAPPEPTGSTEPDAPATPTRDDAAESGTTETAESGAESGTGTPPEPLTQQLAGGTDGRELTDADYRGSESAKTGLYALEKADLFTLLCLPPSAPSGDLPATVWPDAVRYCQRRGALLLVDPPAARTVADLGSWPASIGLVGTVNRNAALYFPRVRYPDPLRGGAVGTFVPSGAVAGVMAGTDASRGVWKAPAGLEAGIAVGGLAYALTDAEHGTLPDEVNALRSFPNVGAVVWGARTLRGADIFADDYKYVPVRRLALFLEQSLYRGTQWVVFEPNDEPLWSQIRTTVTAFLQDLFRQGAFQGSSPREAYFVQCGADTTTPFDVARGLVNIRVGFAPLRPAEFVVVGIQQLTAATAT